MKNNTPHSNYFHRALMEAISFVCGAGRKDAMEKKGRSRDATKDTSREQVGP
ncbi:MAG: hypothetical protein IPN26_05400 [Bacteroidetes bacterium]|nr:hypothetical protein [Bacteroidota bacterium]